MRTPYHLISLTVIVLIAYFITLSLVKTGIISKVSHRKFWNVILLITFLVSGIPGILLVIQVNYKLEWAFMKPLMKWHVDTGIVMTLVAFFHFIWHHSYFLGLFRKPDLQSKQQREFLPEPQNIHPGRMTLPLLVLGFFATTVQVLVIREITAVFQGNELMMAWTLGIWMFLTGLGSWLGKSFRQSNAGEVVSRVFILLGYIPPLVVLVMSGLRNIFFLPGELVNPIWYLLIVTILLAPVCLLTGYSFSLLVKALGSEEKMFIRVYSLEAAGSVAGGIVVSFLLIRWFSIMQSLLLAALVMHLVVWVYQRSRNTLISGFFLLVILSFFLSFPVDLKIKSFIFENQEVVTTRETPFGNITVCRNGEEYSFYENGSLAFSTGDMVLNEEYVHYAMLQHRNPEEVLLVSGGVAGMAAEILKYPGIRSIDYVELNPGIIQLARPFKPLPADNRISVMEGDGRRFIARSKKTWDVVIFAVPDPSSLQINRYYTTDFLRILKSRLNKEAVVLFGISPAGNYLSPEQTGIEAAIYNSVASLFSHVVIIPGERDYFIASDSPLSDRPGELSSLRGLKASYVNPYYIDDPTISARGEQIREKVSRVKLTNTDMRPIPVFYHTLQYLSRFTGKNLFLMILPLVLFILPLFFMSPVSAGMYVTGLTASSVEILLIFWFQTVFGNVYAAIGIIFAIFMAGLALGSAAGFRLKTDNKSYVWGQTLLAIYTMLLPLLWYQSGASMSGFTAWLLFIPVLLVPAILTGFQYVASTINYHPDRQRAASSIYAADLWGSALGAILITFLLVPLLGVTASCFIIAALNGLVVVYMILRK